MMWAAAITLTITAGLILSRLNEGPFALSVTRVVLFGWFTLCAAAVLQATP